MIYLGGAWPDEYRHTIFMNNIHGQRVNNDILERQGSGFVGRHGKDFLLTGDLASQMLNLRYGPDGQVYVNGYGAAGGVTSFGMEGIPRISRAQKMDALSSQANIAGYKAVLIAAETLVKFFPMMMTAAGTVFAARVLVIGAGVAGLQAIATARRLGAQVWGYDVRPVVKEQVESLGAKFLAFDLGVADAEDKSGYAKSLTADAARRQQDMLAEKTKDFDVVVTTALVPGWPAPRLVTKETVAGMRPGSVIVDLAAEAGGNCELTRPDEVVVTRGVTIHGPTNLPATVPVHASQLYARNVSELVRELVKDGALKVDFDDEIVKGACVTHAGAIVNEAVKSARGTRTSA